MEMSTDRISSLQALLALVWRSAPHAQKLLPDEKTLLSLIAVKDTIARSLGRGGVGPGFE